jgi:acyl-coenzyme A thioesterase 13
MMWRVDTEDGFSLWPRRSPFGDAAGPLLVRYDPGGPVFAVRISEQHANARGTAHGGLLSTVADLALGYAGALSTEPPTQLRTISLSIDFIAAVEVGDLVVIEPHVLRVGSRLAHVRGDLRVGERIAARASAVFAVTDRPASHGSSSAGSGN